MNKALNQLLLGSLFLNVMTIYGFWREPALEYKFFFVGCVLLMLIALFSIIAKGDKE
jgi:hypothetical protein